MIMMKELGLRAKAIINEGRDFEGLECLVKEYPSAPEFVLPFYQGLFYKTAGQYERALPYMTQAKSLIPPRAEIAPIDWFNLYRPFIKVFWGQAGEIYANCNYPELTLDSYKHYQMHSSEIKSTDISEGLLSFRHFSTHMLQDLINNEVTASSPKQMNDPFDTLLLHWGDNALQRKAYNKHTQYFVKSLDNYRIRSFSRLRNNSNEETIKNIQMWSHYANDHYGICIQYNFSPVFSDLTQEDRVIRFKDIIYHDSEAEQKSGANSVIDLSSLESIDTDLALCTKQKFWNYENEVRLISYSPNDNAPYIPIKLDKDSRITKIYFGARCLDRNIETIRNILSGQNVEFYKMGINYSDIYSLTVTQLD